MEHVIKSLDAGVRFDGRKNDEFRNIVVKTGVSKNAEGSAMVLMGDSEVLAGVKLGVEKPYPDTPENGNLMINVELTPLSNPRFESGPPSEEAIEVARVVDRGIREAKAIDTAKLCIAPKENVWGVMVDVVTINSNGSLIDISALATIAAIRDVRMPSFEDGAVKYDKLTNERLPLDNSKLPITVTVYKIGKHLLVDPLPEEEAVADARLSVAVVDDGTLVAMQKGGERPLSEKEVDDMVALAQVKAKELRKLLP